MEAYESSYHEHEVIVNLAEGLHARPVSQLSALAQTHAGNISVGKYVGSEIREYIDAKSPMELILLQSPFGTKLHFRIQQVEGFDIEKLKKDISSILGHSAPN
ncbi:HPr family phosphocarrier protein [Candidatus Pacearchaeota archaeon]|nr:HPr family phosphocarrier protein [Candidatus Pacearchaeota archaeon]